ncbi:hypothetical protein PI124_g6450 [Phytophthora idaei]|nr:hypothetical protein PI125_g6107 [Phytophthora idaei]KAG3162642.1 hypothetical protein PI126_g5891 [Phytophthora idaei]KAG3248862.1 hypothetical protein PI124_g6450 [Phytophthora idaei]
METPSRKRTTQESPPKKRKKRREKKDPLHPNVWFKQEIASILWMPQKADLVAVRKPDDLARKDEHVYADGSNESETRNVGRDTRDERLLSFETVFLNLKEC